MKVLLLKELPPLAKETFRLVLVSGEEEEYKLGLEVLSARDLTGAGIWHLLESFPCNRDKAGRFSYAGDARKSSKLGSALLMLLVLNDLLGSK